MLVIILNNRRKINVYLSCFFLRVVQNSKEIVLKATKTSSFLGFLYFKSSADLCTITFRPSL